MSDFFTVVITYMDGTEERVEWVTKAETREGVLHLKQENRGSYFSETTDLGAYPIHNIRRWKREAR